MDDFFKLREHLCAAEMMLHKIRREKGIESYEEILIPENCLGGNGSHVRIMQNISDKLGAVQSHLHQILR